MKIKNISVGDSVQIKKGKHLDYFKDDEICQVIDIDAGDKYGFDVLIDGQKGLDWVNHKYLKKPEPQLKQLDQSAFDHEYVTNHFYYAAINTNGQSIFFSDKPKCNLELGIWYSTAGSTMPMLKGYDASNWQNSLIDRDLAKELLEVDLSSELTGSELCKAMLERGDRYVMCFVSGMSDAKADSIPKAITSFNSLTRQFRANHDIWRYAVPINNQGEPLTASEVGL